MDLRLNYVNYLFSKVDSKFSSYNIFADVAKTRQNTNYNFDFGINPDESVITKQAEYFADYVISKNLFTNRFDYVTRSSKARHEILKKCYIYSYVKAVFYGASRYSNTNVQIPSRSFVFAGHAELFDVISNGYISMPYLGTERSSVNLRVSFNPTDLISKISEFGIFKKFKKYSGVNGITYAILDTDCEAMLSFIHDNMRSVFSTCPISMTSSDSYDKYKTPLGNGYYSEDMTYFNFVESQYTSSDIVSTFWSHAVCITGISIPYVDTDDALFDTISVSKIDSSTLQFDVEAITGFSPFSHYDEEEFVDIPSRNSYIDGPNGDEDDLGPNPSEGYDSKSRNKKQYKNNRKQRNRPNNKPNVSKLAGNIGNKLNTMLKSQSILTKDNIGIMANVIGSIVNRNVTKKQLQYMIGQSIRSVLEENNVTVGNEIINNTNNVNNYFVEHRNDNKKLIVGLIGKP